MTQNHIGPRPWRGHFCTLVEQLLRVLVTHAAVLAWFLALPISGVAASEICYYPDGSVAGPWTYEPCTANGTAEGSAFSSCCIPSEGDICLTDGLCFFPQSTSTQTSGNYVYRGACTDQAWKDGSCATQCVTNTPNRYESLIYCKGSGRFCCQKAVPSGSCCDYPSMLMKLPDIPEYIMEELRNSTNTTANDVSDETSEETALTPSATKSSPSSLWISSSWTTSPIRSRSATYTSSSGSETQQLISQTSGPGSSFSSRDNDNDNDELSGRASLALGLGIGVPTLLLMVLGLVFQKKVKAVKIKVENGVKSVFPPGSSVGSRTPRASSLHGVDPEAEAKVGGSGSGSGGSGVEVEGKGKAKLDAVGEKEGVFG